MPKFKYAFSKARHIYTGFEGTIMVKHQHAAGCTQYSIMGNSVGGRKPEIVRFDESEIEVFLGEKVGLEITETIWERIECEDKFNLHKDD